MLLYRIDAWCMPSHVRLPVFAWGDAQLRNAMQWPSPLGTVPSGYVPEIGLARSGHT